MREKKIDKREELGRERASMEKEGEEEGKDMEDISLTLSPNSAEN